MNNLIKCPICNFESENLTTHICVIHGMEVKDFKKQFNIKYVQSDRLRNLHKKTVSDNNPTRGRKRTVEEVGLMSTNRIGKGIGLTGKYERTPEIKERISIGVIGAHLRGDFDNSKPGNGSYIFSKKANKTIYARSTWERKMIEVFDLHPRVNYIDSEPFAIPYEFNGIKHNYIPDFLVVYDEVIKSIWEVKRDDWLHDDPKTKAKINALYDYCSANNYNAFVVDSNILKLFSKYIKSIDK